jgi:hypothetical protein
MVYSTKEVEDSIEAELKYHRVNIRIKDIKTKDDIIQSNSNKADPVHPAYIYVGLDKPRK